tara:strand:- start:6507 stop:7838 length:1332 start_codon:yes stop_codon:yes gene_type:complete
MIFSLRKSCLCILLLPVFAWTIVNSSYVLGDSSPPDVPILELQLFAEIFARIKSHYVEDVSDQQLLNDAIEGMLRGLDPHSTFLDRESYKELDVETYGRFGGLGLEVVIENDFIRVVAPIEGSPADLGGIKPGDKILRIEAILVNGMSLDEVVERMRGRPGTKIQLLISRDDGNEPFEITLQRAVIRLDSVHSQLLDERFGYIKIVQFQPDTVKELRQQIRLLERSSLTGLSGLILDLRNNPGGIFDSAIAVSDLFLKEGVIVTTRGRASGTELSYRATENNVLDGVPIVVMVNRGSASASEIFAAALQDHKRALIFGERTFGKGSVQTILPMDNGAALKLTTARYYSPNNSSIQASGILPDVANDGLKFSENNRIVDSGLRESDLTGHLYNDAREEIDSDVKGNYGSHNLKHQDYQVQQAINLLRAMVLALEANEAPNLQAN